MHLELAKQRWARRLSLLVPAAAAVIAAGGSADAALLFDFGATAVTNTSPNFDATVSAAHAAGAVPAGQVTYNTVGSADIASGLLNSDGTAATGVGIDLGASALNGTSINFASATNSTSLTGSDNTLNGTTGGITTIYSGTRVARDGIFASGASTTQDFKVGVQITGLATGVYTVYVAGRNTNTGTATPERFFAAAAAPATSFDFSLAPSADESNPAGSGFTSYVLGTNYQQFTVPVVSGQALYVVADGITPAGEERGFLNSVEVTPEPASAGLLAVGALGLWRDAETADHDSAS